jgi:hypothetical protein
VKIKKHKKQIRSNKRVGIVNGIEGGLAQAGYFTPEVQRVVKKWRGCVLDRFIREYFWAIARAAFWHTKDLELHVYARAHWPLVWELAAAVEKVRALPKTHPHYWLLRLPIQVATNGEHDLWKEIGWQIKERGGPAFSPVTLRQSAKRLGLVAPSSLAVGYLKSPLAAF